MTERKIEGTQRKLELELERLKRLLDLGYELKLKWSPKDVRNSRGKLISGEVVGGTVYIYEKDEAAAVATLQHEMVDFAISQAIEPYKEMTNRLILMINEDAYRTKEKIVERLRRLVG